MFDFGWQEFIVIGFVLVMVVGPKDLPKVLRAVTRLTSQARRMANEFRNGIQDIAAHEDLKDVKQMMHDAKSGKLDDMATFIGGEDHEELQSIGSEIEKNIKEIQEKAKDATQPSKKP